jgi:hypothetical protein
MGGAGLGKRARAYTGEESPDEVSLTRLPDTILGEDDADTWRGVMSCGHAVDPEALFNYAK